MGRRSKRKQRELRREERRRDVTALIKAGQSYREIVDTLRSSEKHRFVSLGTVANDVSAVLTSMRQESIQDLVTAKSIDLARMDDVILALSPAVNRGHLNSIDRYIRALEYRAKVLGYAAPEVHVVGGSDELPPIKRVTAGIDVSSLSDDQLRELRASLSAAKALPPGT